MRFRVGITIDDERMAVLCRSAGQDYEPLTTGFKADNWSDLEIVRAFCAVLDKHEEVVDNLIEEAKKQGFGNG